MNVPIIAGTIATMVFALSNLPMLRKALRTRNVSSYSLSSLVMINGANGLYSVYVFSLPFGPIWALHTFYVVSCGIMLALCLHQRRDVVGPAGSNPPVEAASTSRPYAAAPSSIPPVPARATSGPGALLRGSGR
jgi:uncharacterized protein with PQ loop repeat